MVFKKNHYVTFNHCTSLPHIIFCIMFLMYLNILFYYYTCIITFNIDYCYMYVLLLHTPSHVWPEFNKLLSIVYCLKTFNRPSGIQIVCLGYFWFHLFIEMLIKNI